MSCHPIENDVPLHIGRSVMSKEVEALLGVATIAVLVLVIIGLRLLQH